MRLKLSMTLLLVGQFVYGTTITNLLNAVDKRPQSMLDQIDVDKATLGVEKISDKMMPTLDGFVGYEVYSRPSSLRPVLPSEMRDLHAALPFSKNIGRAGIKLSWPIFVKSLYTLKGKATLMQLASKDKKRLGRIQREAQVVGSVAYLHYMEAMHRALKVKVTSIMATKKKIALMVKEGRLPQSQLLTLDAKINNLKMNIVGIEQQKNTLEATIETLTGIALRQSVRLRQKRALKKGAIFALAPLQKRLKAAQMDVKAAKERYYPSVAMKGSYTLSQADAYNNEKSVNTGYGSVGMYVNVPLYDSSRSTGVEEAKLNYLKEHSQIEETKERLEIKAKELRREIRLLKRTYSLAKKNVAHQKSLLKIAKVSLANEVVTQEEYLRYEDALADAKATLYKSEAKKWQDIAQLAVIYGIDLKRIVK